MKLDAKGGLIIDDLSRSEVSTLFERELDEIHSTTAPADNTLLTAAERERFERECAAWRRALHRRVRDALRTHSILVPSVTWDGAGEFCVRAYDARYRHRDYSVSITVGEALAIAELHDRAPLEAISRDVIQQIFAARDEYARRMS